MVINENLAMLLSHDGEKIVVNIGGTTHTIYKTEEKFAPLRAEYMTLRNMSIETRKTANVEKVLEILGAMAEGATTIVSPREMLTGTMQRLVSFFTEFQFEPNFRFVNTLSHCLESSRACGTDYVVNYFELTDNPYRRELGEKIKSSEFKAIIKDLASVAPDKTINTRFKVYYGSQGTGKTTLAMSETDGRCMVCNSSMLPSDLMEDFVFVDGKATFQPSALWRSMVEGTKITLDEINLLPFDSLRFLQTILDGKKEFLYKGNKVEIADGFQIIGTINLTVNGMTYGLPEPLIDRASEMRKFTLTPEQLASAICSF